MKCDRCGQSCDMAAVMKRIQRRGLTGVLCGDCAAKPQRLFGDCVAWQGECDLDTFQPLKNGKPFMLGKRKCGLLDCVNPKHIFEAKKFIEPIVGEWTFGKAFVAVMRSEGFGDALEVLGVRPEMSFADLKEMATR